MNYIFLASLLSYVIYLRMELKHYMHMYQQNRYETDIYFNHIKERRKEYFLSFNLLFLIFILFKFTSIRLSLITFYLVYSFILMRYINESKKVKEKKPLVMTPRVRRMFITIDIIFIIIISLMTYYFNESYYYLYSLLLGLLSYIAFIIPVIANIINKPIEKSVFNHYKRKCKNKLKSLTNMDVIGITGSYGKTSSKNILNDVLNVKYNSFKTPKNFNTPNGLMITVNNHLDKFNDYFIAEMGACRVHEIKELCDLVHPKYGIITKIGTAHLETFETEENIENTKFELVESLPEDGIAVLNADDPKQLNHKIKNKVKVLWIGIDNKDVDLYATNIKLTNKGTTFDCVFKGDKKKYKFETKLLGKANIYNILASILLGKELGISADDLIRGVKKVKAVEHRLEMKKMNGINIIDDAYNSNPVGSKMALDVLSMMDGKKIIVTPGMIELGPKQYELNKEFGKYMKGKTDEIILIGKEQTKAIYDGIKESKFDMKHVHILNDVREAFPLLTKLKDGETYALLENDLPDLFSEKK